MEAFEVRLLPQSAEVLLLALDVMGDPVLKARLPPLPSHPRAASTVLEGLALWSGRTLPVAIGVGKRSASSIEALFPDGNGWCSPLFDLHLVEARRVRRRRRLDGLGDFREAFELRLPWEGR